MTTAAGTTLGISVSAPSAEDEAGYSALTFTEIGQIEKIGVIGAAFNKVEFTPLKGPKRKHKGSSDNGSLQPSMALDPVDAGQTLLRTAAANLTALFSFCVTFPDGAKRFFRGRVFGFPENVDGADSIVTATPTIEINSEIVRTGAPSPEGGGDMDFSEADASGLLALILEDA